MADHAIVSGDGASPRPVSGVVRDVVRDVEGLVRAEMRLARHELAGEAREAAKAIRPLSLAAVTGFFAAACFVTTLIVCLAIALPLWLACLLMSVMLGGAAGGAFLMGRFALDKVDPTPQRTVETLKETVTWARIRTK